jgi:hypothetical protein
MVSWPMVGRGQRRNLSQKAGSVWRKTSVSLQPSGVSCTSHACQTDTTNCGGGHTEVHKQTQYLQQTASCPHR